MGALDGRNDSLSPGQVLEGLHSLVVGHRHILSPANIVKMRMLRSHARIIQSCGNGVYRRYLSIFILAEIGLHAVEDT